MVEIKEYIGHKPVEIKTNVNKKKKNTVKKDTKKEDKDNGVQENDKKQ